MLLIALFSWWGGYVGLTFNRSTITLVIGGLLIVNLILGWIQRDELKEHFKNQKKYILITELVILAFFLIDLGIRIGNPDLWHVSKGGEKPMDFSYFNAILKSTTIPPYDPWYSGGYINYYYYGFVIVGVLVKWLGIVPSVAYNLILPTLFSLLAIGAYAVVYNAVVSTRDPEQKSISPYWFAIGAAFGLTMLGNLGTLRMIWYGLQQLAAPGGTITDVGVNFFTRMGWTFQGLIKFFGGENLPYNIGDWYWNPSRVIPEEPITEFPFFTFLYADMHAHMIALPVTMLVIGWITSIILGKGKWGSASGKFITLSLGLSLFFGATAVGALRPTNTWDFPTYLVLALVALLYIFFRYRDSFSGGWLDYRFFKNRWIKLVCILAVFGVLTLYLYYPFSAWYGAGYTSAQLWDGSRTPFWSYMTHWGYLPVLHHRLADSGDDRLDGLHTAETTGLFASIYRLDHRIGCSAVRRDCRPADVWRRSSLAGVDSGSLGGRSVDQTGPERYQTDVPVLHRQRIVPDPGSGSHRAGGRYRPHEYRFQVLPSGLDAAGGHRRGPQSTGYSQIGYSIGSGIRWAFRQGRGSWCCVVYSSP